MKKFAASVIVALLMSAGLVSASSTTATAAYPGTVETTTNASNFGAVRKNQRVRLRVAVREANGTRIPRGTVRINYVRKNGGKRVSYERVYTSPITYDFPALRRPGQYIVRVKFFPRTRQSVFKSSGTTAGQYVRNRPRR